MYGGISECHRKHDHHITCVTNINNNNGHITKKNNVNIASNHNHRKQITFTKDEIDRINSMNEDDLDLENLINQTIQERWQNTLHAVSQPQPHPPHHHHHHHHRDLSSTEPHLTDDDESSTSSTASLTSNLSSSDDDEAPNSSMLISKNATKALSRSFSQTMYWTMTAAQHRQHYRCECVDDSGNHFNTDTVCVCGIV